MATVNTGSGTTYVAMWESTVLLVNKKLGERGGGGQASSLDHSYFHVQ